MPNKSMKKVKKRGFFVTLGDVIKNVIKKRNKQKKNRIKVNPIGDCNLTQNVRAIGQETNRLDPLIFKTGDKMSSPVINVKGPSIKYARKIS